MERAKHRPDTRLSSVIVARKLRAVSYSVLMGGVMKTTKRRLILAIGLALTFSLSAIDPRVNAAGAAASQLDKPQPALLGVRLKGKKLIVEGANFDQNAVIRINNKIQETAPDLGEPANVLIARKGAKKIELNEFTNILVENEDGQRSNVARVIKTQALAARLVVFALHPELQFINLRVPGFLLIDSRGLPATENFGDGCFMRVPAPGFDDPGYRLYKVLSAGDTLFEIAQVSFDNGLPGPPPIIWRLPIHID